MCNDCILALSSLSNSREGRADDSQLRSPLRLQRLPREPSVGTRERSDDGAGVRGDTRCWSSTRVSVCSARGGRGGRRKSRGKGGDARQRSAHSFATGPAMAEPFISPLGLTMTPALSSKSVQWESAGCGESQRVDRGRTRTALRTEEDTVAAAPGLALANDDRRVDLLAQFRLTLLDL